MKMEETMTSALMGKVNPLAPEPVVADKATIRKFVKDLSEVADKIKDARDDMNEAIKSNDDIQNIDDQIKSLKEDRKELLSSNVVIMSYKDILNDAVEDKRQVVSDAKQDGVPRKEINTAIKMLKTDVDPQLATEVYANIADLVG
jgi:predicted  nucleic acid-binding Zn-ribbon protein